MTADTLGYLSLEGLGAAVGIRSRGTFCTACFTGKYLTALAEGAAAAARRRERLTGAE